MLDNFHQTKNIFIIYIFLQKQQVQPCTVDFLRQTFVVVYHFSSFNCVVYFMYI